MSNEEDTESLSRLKLRSVKWKGGEFLTLAELYSYLTDFVTLLAPSPCKVFVNRGVLQVGAAADKCVQRY